MKDNVVKISFRWLSLMDHSKHYMSFSRNWLHQ